MEDVKEEIVSTFYKISIFAVLVAIGMYADTIGTVIRSIDGLYEFYKVNIEAWLDLFIVLIINRSINKRCAKHN